MYLRDGRQGDLSALKSGLGPEKNSEQLHLPQVLFSSPLFISICEQLTSSNVTGAHVKPVLCVDVPVCPFVYFIGWFLLCVSDLECRPGECLWCSAATQGPAVTVLLTELSQPLVHILHGRVHARLVIGEGDPTSRVEYIRGVHCL